MRYRAVVSYFGANYCGWQIQKNDLSVQEVMENALSKVFQTPTTCVASGRTDAGVHAYGQVIHFDAETSIPVDKIPYAVNTCLPNDVSMLSCEVVDDDFNARFSAKKKTYCYKFYLSHHRNPILEPTHAHVMVPLDCRKMREAADLIEGTHDFKCFEAAGSKVKTTVRIVYSIEFDVEHKSENDFIFDTEFCVSVTGNGFLYNMVRIIAGTLVYVGMGKLSVEDVKKILESGDRTQAGKTLPPQGLHLMSVFYEK